MNRTTTGLAAVFLAASVGVTGCGGSSGKSDAKSSSSTSSSASSDAVDTSDSGSYTPLTKANFASSVATATKSKKSAHMVMKMGTLLNATADVDYGSSSPKAAMTSELSLGGQKMKIEARLVDGAFYIAVPGQTPSGKFVKVDKDTPGLGQLAGSLGSTDPSKLTDAFSKGVTDLTYRGPEQIDGDTTYHYTLVVDTSKSLDAMGLGSLPQASSSKMPKTLTEQVYLNADNTLRRGLLDVSGQKGQFDLTGWGQPVSVTAPPKSDLVSLPVAPQMPSS